MQSVYEAEGGLQPVSLGDIWNSKWGRLADEDALIPVAIVDRPGTLRILGPAMVRGEMLSKGFQASWSNNLNAFLRDIPPEARAGGNSLFVASALISLANRFLGTPLNINGSCRSLLNLAWTLAGIRATAHADLTERVIRRRTSGSASELRAPMRGITDQADVADLGIDAAFGRHLFH